MSNIPRNIKKSDFNSQSTIPAGSTFDFVINGTNIKIPVADMISAFGTAGTLEQLGEIVGTAVLSVSGTVNRIRNILGGAGILASVSPENGLQLDHNFVSGGAVDVLINPTAEQPIIRGIKAGPGVNVASDGNLIQVSAIELPVASNVVIVNAMGDFPDATEGVRTLADNTAYLVSAILTTSDRFIAGDNCVLYGADSATAGLIYTGTDTMFTGTSDSFKLTLISLTAETGQLFNVSTAASTGVFQLINVTIPSCNILGTVTNMQAIQITDIFVAGIISSGITFSGDIGVVLGSRNLFSITAGSVFDLGTAIINSGFSMGLTYSSLGAGSFFLSGLVDSGNLAAGTIGSISNCNVKGAGTALQGITESDALWEFSANNGIFDSINSILAVHGVSTIIIAAAGTPVIIGATWTISHASRFTGSAGGRFTYIGKGAHISISATITADLATGADNCTFYFYKNGIQESASAITREFDAGNPGNIGMLWQLDMDTDDYVEIWVENNDTSVNIDILNAIIGIS